VGVGVAAPDDVPWRGDMGLYESVEVGGNRLRKLLSVGVDALSSMWMCQ